MFTGKWHLTLWNSAESLHTELARGEITLDRLGPIQYSKDNIDKLAIELGGEVLSGSWGPSDPQQLNWPPYNTSYNTKMAVIPKSPIWQHFLEWKCSWWYNDMEMLSALLVPCSFAVGQNKLLTNSQVTSSFICHGVHMISPYCWTKTAEIWWNIQWI